MTLEPLTLQNALDIVSWRNEQLQNLRTPKPLTMEQQKRWYENMVDDNTQYWWGVWENGVFVGYCGIQKIDWIARHGELSLLFEPGEWNIKAALPPILDKAFGQLNLNSVYSDIYLCNNELQQWIGALRDVRAKMSMRYNWKWWNGRYWDGYFYQIMKDDYALVVSDQ